jgi:hypothetical protein
VSDEAKLCRECGEKSVRELNWWFCSQACAKAKAMRALESADVENIVRTGRHVIDIND